ncbi:hypothetical protein MiSe_81790 [Microseira wollei NIES-4236]|uniref:Uncharacterized protein n=1 Tax=Microseira wollei NIES-4236 TaxID=2530354 RepID=A0AAV3XRU2_9CYAN|nr:hypothetical protein [Microseira wollei]GET43357.1 hypothetical protein MiSe_81790 [Microseira wollei NIES-4236]
MTLLSLPALERQGFSEVFAEKSGQESGKSVNLGEFTWNHATLHARSADISINYLQSLFPADKNLRLVEQMYEYFGDEVMMH